MTKPTRASRRADARAGASNRVTANRASSRTRHTGKRNPVVALVHDHPYIVLAILVALNLLFAFLTFLPQPDTGGDSSNYLTLGRSLLQGHSYTDLYDPVQPMHTKYPPVFPLILAAAMMMGLKTWVQLKLLLAVMGSAAVAVTFLWLRRRGRPALAVGVSLLLIFSADVLDQSHQLLSDVPFWLFTMIALLAFDRLRPKDWPRLAIAIAAAMLAYFTRSAGLPLVLAIIAWLALRRRWPQLAVFVAVLVPLALLWWLRAHRTGGVEYTQEFWYVDPYRPELGRIGLSQLLQRMAENATKYATIHLPILLGARTGGVNTSISLMIIALAVFGWVLRLRRAMVAEIMMPLYIGLLLVWPAVWSGERFLLPVFPLLLYYAWTGVTFAARKLVPQWTSATLVVGAVVVALLLMLDVPQLTASIVTGRTCTAMYMAGEPYPCLQEAERAYFDAAIYTQGTLPADAVVLSRKPRVFYEISHGVRGTNYPMTRDPRVFFTLTDSVHARFVVYDRLTGLADFYLAPILLQRPQAFCLVKPFGTDGTTMFGIVTGASRITDAPVSAADAHFPPCDRSFYR